VEKISRQIRNIRYLQN